MPDQLLWALVQEVVGHDYLVRCALLWILIFHQNKLWHAEDKGISAVVADDR